MTGEITPRLHRVPDLRAPGARISGRGPARRITPATPGGAAALGGSGGTAGATAGAGEGAQGIHQRGKVRGHVGTFTVVADQAEEGQDRRPAGEALLEDPPGDHGGGAQRRAATPRATLRLKAAIGVGQGGQHARRQRQARHPEGHRRAPGESYEEITYEGYGPGGVAVLIRVLTDNKNRTGPELRHTFEKNSGRMGTVGLRGVDVRPARRDRRWTPSGSRRTISSRRRSTPARWT